MIRRAELADLDGLVALEEEAFTIDRLTRRSFRYMLTKAHAVTLVAVDGNGLLGYSLILFRSGTALARLYSIAVAARARGKGLGKVLLSASEEEALAQDCAAMRSEVRKDNASSLALFHHAGYREFDQVDGYYEDGMGAVRLERVLVPTLRRSLTRVPYYEQTLDFTCGAAALIMAMQSLRPEEDLPRKVELRIWREATSIFMTSGHGGCGPYGLALAAVRRGFSVRLFVKERGVFLGETVRSAEKREVMRLVEEDFLGELEALGVAIEWRSLTVSELRAGMAAGAIPLVLASSYRMYGTRMPHWLVITGFDDRFAYVHDPFIDCELGKSQADSVNVPIAHRELERMTRYGKSGQRSVLLVSQ